MTTGMFIMLMMIIAENRKLIAGTELEGSIFIDVRLHNQFLCQYINLCFKREDDGAKTIKAVIL